MIAQGQMANESANTLYTGVGSSLGQQAIQQAAQDRRAEAEASNLRLARQTALDFALRAGEPLQQTLERAEAYRIFLSITVDPDKEQDDGK